MEKKTEKSDKSSEVQCDAVKSYNSAGRQRELRERERES